MKNQFLTLMAISQFLLIVVSCKKTQEKPETTMTAATEQEQVKVLSTTSMSKAINLPAMVNLSRSTKTPIIFVHGFLGFGPNEAFSAFHYWGGFTDIIKDLNNQGYLSYAASVGPISSNWDRAVELYYYIKGGTLDYGKLHSSKFGHKQHVTRTYKGIYPEWDENHPINLVGHSMGGTTIRKLITLLEKGDSQEQGDILSSSLFSGNKKGWIKTAVTISTPHNGTSLTNILGVGNSSFVLDALNSVASLSGGFGSNSLYDFDLDQWGLERNPKTTNFFTYYDNVKRSKLWTTNDSAPYDLSPAFSQERNQVDLDSKDIYYFSVTTRATSPGILTGHEYPGLSTFPVLYPFALSMGSYTSNEPGKPAIDRKWWPNDGIVNVYGENGPSNGVIREYDTNSMLQKGVWNHLGVYNGYDHTAIVGIGTLIDVKPFYRNLAKLITSI
ncbi:lipase [Pedobacter sp. PAMC26386]|nr:lipase [Pedobacter sp. PAMC26386]